MHVPSDILVTGFGSFPGVETNPTESIIDDLRKTDSQHATRHTTLPVSFERVFVELTAKVETYSPTKLLHLGVSGEAREIRIETRAHNHVAAMIPDIDGRQPRNNRINRDHPRDHTLAGSPTADAIIAALGAKGLPAAKSTDAGRYVCNALFYISLHHYGSEREVTFIHIPSLGTPGPTVHTDMVWSTQTLQEAMSIIVESI